MCPRSYRCIFVLHVCHVRRRIHTCMSYEVEDTCMYLCVYLSSSLSLFLSLSFSLSLSLHTQVCVCVCMCTCMCVRACVHMYIYNSLSLSLSLSIYLSLSHTHTHTLTQDIPRPSDGKHALHIAAVNGSTLCVKALVALGASRYSPPHMTCMHPPPHRRRMHAREC